MTAAKPKENKKTEEFAVIKTGGKQYKVHEKDILRVEKFPEAEGKIVKTDKVLLNQCPQK